jgi:outer membrane lipoprotein SlyB
MKKILTISILSATLLLTGCTNSGLGVNPSSGATVKQAFEIGTVQSSQKVLIDEGSMNTTLTGAAIGGGAMMLPARADKLPPAESCSSTPVDWIKNMFSSGE